MLQCAVLQYSNLTLYYDTTRAKNGFGALDRSAHREVLVQLIHSFGSKLSRHKQQDPLLGFLRDSGLLDRI